MTTGDRDDLVTLAADAWLYFLPLLITELTRASEPDVEVNSWRHAALLRSDEFDRVIRPNVDTVYSDGWLDLASGPVVLSMPDVNGRYVVVQAMNEWSATFAVVGTRSMRSAGETVVFVGPEQAGEPDVAVSSRAGAPADALVIRSATNSVWLLMRIQSFGDDGEEIAALQEQFLLDAPPRMARQSVAEEVAQQVRPGNPPPHVVLGLGAASFFTWAASRWGTTAPPLPADRPTVGRLATLGIAPGHPLVWDDLDVEQRAALDGARDAALARLLEVAGRQGGVHHDDWYYLRDNWYRVDGHLVDMQQPTNYTLRAGLAIEALGYLPAQEASYVSAGVSRVGGDDLRGADGPYVVRLPPDGLPQVAGFWSMTVYQGRGYLVRNRHQRFSLGSRDSLTTDPDGGVTMLLSIENPAGADAAPHPNWLPLPEGEFSLSFRAYLPTVPIGPGGWLLPPLKRRETASGRLQP